MAVNPNFAGLITDFIALQSVPTNIGNVVKGKVENGQIDVASLGLAMAATAQTAAGITQTALYPTAAAPTRAAQQAPSRDGIAGRLSAPPISKGKLMAIHVPLTIAANVPSWPMAA